MSPASVGVAAVGSVMGIEVVGQSVGVGHEVVGGPQGLEVAVDFDGGTSVIDRGLEAGDDSG